MKIIKIVLSIIVILFLILFITISIIINTFDISRYKTQIIQQASNLLGRNVQIQDLDLAFSLQKGVVLNVKGIEIADIPQFSQEKIFRAENIRLSVDLLALWKENKLLVSSVDIRNPMAVIIRDKNGQFNIQNWGNKRPSEESSVNPPVTQAPAQTSPVQGNKTAPQEQGQAFPTLFIKSITIKDGVIIYQDKFLNPELNLELSNLEFRISDFSLTQPSQFFLQMSLWSDQQNIKLEGLTQVDFKNSQVRFDDVKCTMDLSSLSLTRLTRTFPFLANYISSEGMNGKYQCLISPMMIGPQGLLTLALKMELTDGKVKVNQLSKPIETIRMDLDMNESKIVLNDFFLTYGSGNINAQGKIEDYLHQQKFSVNSVVQHIALADIIPPDKQAIKLQGYLNGKYQFTGQGFAPDVIQQSLLGEGGIDLTEAEIVDMNVLRIVLDKISLIPQLVEKVEGALPDRYKEILKRQNTKLNKVSLVTKTAKGKVDITEAVLEADGFSIIGDGQLGFDQMITFNVSIFIDADLASSMIAAIPELEYIKENDRRIKIPLQRFEGNIKDIQIIPDLEYLGKKIIRNKGKEEIQKLLDKVFDKGKDQSSGQGNTNGQDKSGQEPVRPEQEIIGNILDAIFK